MCDSFPSKHAMLHMNIAPSNSKREGSGSRKGIGVVVGPYMRHAMSTKRVHVRKEEDGVNVKSYGRWDLRRRG